MKDKQIQACMDAINNKLALLFDTLWSRIDAIERSIEGMYRDSGRNDRLIEIKKNNRGLEIKRKILQDKEEGK